MNNDFHKAQWKAAASEGKMDPQTDKRIEAAIRAKIKPTRSRKRYYVAAAAAVVMLMALGSYFMTLDLALDPAKSSPALVSYITAAKGKTITLADGSTIVMEPHSELVLEPGFGSDSRPIRYTGKGTFSIAKDPNRPFVINAEGFEVRVLGTKFYLDQTQGRQRVELHEGKVQIQHDKEIIFLHPNESWVQNEPKPVSKEPIVPGDTRQFTFENQSFESIIAQLEREFKLEIEYPDKYRDQEIKGSVTGTIDELIFTLCYPLNLHPEKITETKFRLKE